VAVLGLAFKPETDDMRDSPAIPIVKGLQKRGASIRAYDPHAMENCRSIFENVTYCEDAYATAIDADVLVIATEWNEFRALNLARIKKSMHQPILVDLRNVYDPKRVRALGFRYTSVGRGDEGVAPPTAAAIAAEVSGGTRKGPA